MSSSCAINTCKRKSRALCHCCSKNLCLDHLKEHNDLIHSQLNPLVDEINTLHNQISGLNVDEIIDKGRQKLDKWRHDCYNIIDRLYEEKCQELQQHCIQQSGQKRKKIHQLKLKTNELIQEQEATHDDIFSLKATINDIKRDINQFEENGIIVDVHPLMINQNLVYIEEFTSNELDILNLSSPYRSINCPNDDSPVLASNNQFLLLDQYPNLCLFNKELTLLKQIPWEYGHIHDMCWSSTINSFIIITSKNEVFLIDENLTSIKCIQTIEKKPWLSRTCSDTSLFLATNDYTSDIFQFNLLSSFHFIKQWKYPQTCNYDELIHNIAYNNGTLALIISQKYNKQKRIELRSSSTLEKLWLLPFDTTSNIGQQVYRVCSLKYDEWLVIDHSSSHLLHVSKDGKVKTKRSYEPKVHNAVLFGSNILAIRTANCVNYYRV
ncbi:unnamed protein product [Rotaria sordida]|uniref:Uncharacterized protein n=1 Tax=Rotaria sordida TaxID=392033 RepID=A0A814P6U2_9BILA|nr:unnamed protein product [Rotaria sordida]